MSQGSSLAFTDEVVAELPVPDAEQVEYRDTHPQAPPGFLLRVSYGGRKTYYLMLRVGKRRQRKKIGSSDDLNVEEARAVAREVRKKQLENEDPAVAAMRSPREWEDKVATAANEAVASATDTSECSPQIAGREFLQSPEAIQLLIDEIADDGCSEAVKELTETKRILETSRERLRMRMRRLLPVAEAVANNQDRENALASFKAKYYASGKPK